MSKKAKVSVPPAVFLAEILRLQKWAGGESVDPARIFGLMHGFETSIESERACFGISRAVQDRVEDLLDDIDQGRFQVDRLSIKARLKEDGIDETVAGRVMELCRLQSRFTDVIDSIAKECSGFNYLSKSRMPEQDWLGATHFIELVDCTEDTHQKLHGCVSAAVPRIGETVTPESGSRMKVVDVEYVVTRQGETEGCTQTVLIPFVYLECEPEE